MVLQRQCTTPECEEEEKIQMQPISPLVQRQIDEETTQDISDQILQDKGSGRLLEKETKEFMESRFGHDFGDVRVHTDSNAENLTKQLSAAAFTIGRDVYFGSGKYNPSVTSGQRLLAHELTHVVQAGRRLLRKP